MITMEQWMNLVEFRITEGSEFTWNCFGANAYSLSSWDGDIDGSSFNIVFDSKTQEVYCVESCDYRNNRAYRIINSNYIKQYKAEVKDRESEDFAWDAVKWTDLEVDEDWLEKSKAIYDGVEYDTDILIPLDLPEKDLLFLFQQAHKAKMTFNDYVSKVLREAFNNDDFIKHMESLKKN